MTSPEAAPRNAATPTGRWLQDQLHDDAAAFWAMTSGRFSIRRLVVKVQQAILAIEAEAAAEPLRGARLSAWQRGYNAGREAAAGTALPSGSPEPDGLDAERFRDALNEYERRAGEGCWPTGNLSTHTTECIHMMVLDLYAEYARLAGEDSK